MRKAPTRGVWIGRIGTGVRALLRAGCVRTDGVSGRAPQEVRRAPAAIARVVALGPAQHAFLQWSIELEHHYRDLAAAPSAPREGPRGFRPSEPSKPSQDRGPRREHRDQAQRNPRPRGGGRPRLRVSEGSTSARRPSVPSKTNSSVSPIGSYIPQTEDRMALLGLKRRYAYRRLMAARTRNKRKFRHVPMGYESALNVTIGVSTNVTR